MKNILRVFAAVMLGGLAGGVQAATIDLASDDGTGYLALSSVKSSTSAEAAEAWNFPYYLEESTGIYRSIAAIPLSADSVYAEESEFTVLGKDVTSSDFNTMSAGSVSFDDSLLLGSGVETVATADLTLVVDGDGFSPYMSDYNSGTGLGDFAFHYTITTSNISGNGLTFVDGQLTSVDLDADVSVAVDFGNIEAFAWDDSYDGSLSISGADYAFDLDVSQPNVTPLAPLESTRMVFNRSGSIAAVTPVPEASSYAMMLCGLLFSGVVARRRRKA